VAKTAQQAGPAGVGNAPVCLPHRVSCGGWTPFRSDPDDRAAQSSPLPATTVVASLALGFHCAAMFLPAVVSSLPGSIGAARAVRDLGLVSQIAYWVPAALLLTALRRAWPPLLVIEGGALLAVGVTMSSGFGLPAHLVAIAGSVAVTVAVLTTLGESPAGRTNGAERSWRLRSSAVDR